MITHSEIKEQSTTDNEIVDEPGKKENTPETTQDNDPEDVPEMDHIDEEDNVSDEDADPIGGMTNEKEKDKGDESGSTKGSGDESGSTEGSGDESGSTKGSGDENKGKVENVVSLKGVSKHYGAEGNLVRALDNVNLKIKRGSVVAIMGPSGSGKSTLINMIGSLDVPTHGEVIIDGVNLENMTSRELTKYRSEKVGFVFQSFNLLPNLTALENVELPMEFMEKYRKERRERAEKLLKSIRMSKRADHVPASLSGGEKQRVAIARALANNPSIILADEPTGNLDSKTGAKIIELLKELAKNRAKTLIIVTHDQNIARMADEIINIRDGKITRIRDVNEEKIIQEISSLLDIRKQLANHLLEAGYRGIDEVLDLDEEELKKVKGLKNKERSHIINRIEKFKKRTTQETDSAPAPEGKKCPHCGKHVPMMEALFCPFCTGKLD